MLTKSKNNLIKELTNQNIEAKYTKEIIEVMVTNFKATAAICNVQWKYT